MKTTRISRVSVGPPRTADMSREYVPDLGSSIVLHHLVLFGWPDRATPRICLLDHPRADAVSVARIALAGGRTVVALSPDTAFCSAFDVEDASHPVGDAPALFSIPSPHRSSTLGRLVRRLSRTPEPASRRLRTLYPWLRFQGQAGEPILCDPDGAAAWWWLPANESGVLFIGSDLAGDLLRYRQGDPSAAARQGDRERWGYAGERPNYLFEAQRSGEPLATRHADEWAWFLSRSLADRAGVALDPILPGGAPGAVVLTGDDDQAALACYREQLEVIGDAPITYFLHPLTKHTPETVRSLLKRPGVELALHPDALDAPDVYEHLFREQAEWFNSLAGRPPRAVRNHGFLNRGYWGHLRSWLDADIDISSNIPGLDGTVLNGSLLPARVAFDGRLTEHWSILTAIGDGVLFAGGLGPKRAAECVFDCANRIKSSGIPGVMVLNLHPENISRSRSMHIAAIEVCRAGFIPWTLGECHRWFSSRDASAASAASSSSGHRFLRTT